MRVEKSTATAAESEGPSDRGISAWLAGDDTAMDHLRAVVADDGPCGAPGSEQGDGGSESRAYLESNTACCGNPNEPQIRQGYELHPCKCRSRFCKKCCVHLGLKLRDDLIPVLKTFQGLQMWTLTIDPELFASPQEALEYCRKKRVVGELIKALRRAGVLHSDRYVWVMEWQKDTEMPHYHLLVDASFVPFDLVCKIWNRFRPKAAGPIQGQRPGFGAVRFSAPKFADATHAAHYACKYVIKHPEQGFPQWVLDFQGNMLRYSVSKGFWPKAEGDKVQCEHLDSKSEGHDPACFCEVCRGEAVSEEDANDHMPAKRGKSIAERIAQCGQSTLVLQFEEFTLLDGTTKKQYRFMANVPLSFVRASDLVAREAPEGAYIEVSKEDARWLRDQFRPVATTSQRWDVFDEWNATQTGGMTDDSEARGGSDSSRGTLYASEVATTVEPERSSVSGTTATGPPDNRLGTSQLLFWRESDPVFRRAWD